jgi:dihydrofolate reductase
MAGKVFIHATMSLDGFIADRDDRLDFAFGFDGLPAQTVRDIVASIGAILAGRRGYDLGVERGGKPYGGAWTGPCFIVTHRPVTGPADPEFTFLSGGLRSAVETARAAANGKDVAVFGASLAQQGLAEGLIDEIRLHVVPVVLGEGIRLFAPGAERITLETISVRQYGDLTDLHYRVPAGTRA